MLNIQHFKVNFIEENCYVVSDETREAVIIDCGAFFPEEKAAISSYLAENKLVLRICSAPTAISTMSSARSLFATPIIFSPRCAPTSADLSAGRRTDAHVPSSRLSAHLAKRRKHV